MDNYRLLNCNRGYTVATGLYRPKMTAVLFEKYEY